MTDLEPGRYTRVLAIAGSDSGGGAGIQADLKTFAALGCYGMTAITAVTAQDTLRVHRIHAVPAEMVTAQIEAVLGDIGVDAVKIGMLLAADTVHAVARALAALPRHVPVVLDPVMAASSGRGLLEPEALQAMVRELFPRCTLVTPNLDEATHLLGRPVSSLALMTSAAAGLRALGAPAVLLKGGHLAGDTVTDVLATSDGIQQFHAPRMDSRNLHGTGCTLSSAIAAHLALGLPLHAAVAQGRAFVREAIAAGAGVHTGQGPGPLNQGHAPRVLRPR